MPDVRSDTYSRYDDLARILQDCAEGATTWCACTASGRLTKGATSGFPLALIYRPAHRPSEDDNPPCLWYTARTVRVS